ncbi:hypothetical protein CTI12_AA017510 [Artemisia annua]|uniref:Helitron helicase-like domain-containing protein n=1 Tax=Artemisia annua TaxID=35608 RepID=A0A2U1Q8F4_ARTAN|nr:hypothetical protein CTI12_AA017510 [Artemisia annua]
MAKDMPMDGLHSLACDSAPNCQPATSVSDGVWGGGPMSNVVLTAALESPAPVLETPSHAAQQVRVTPVQSMMPAHVNAVSQLPAQAITVDGLVLTFIAANIMPDPFRCDGSRLTSEGSAAVPTQLFNNRIPEYAPMVLDFSAGEVVQNHVPAESSSNGQPTLPRARMPTRRRSHARGMRASFNRQHAQAGHSHVEDVNAALAQGPLAPPERAPLDYNRFGSCDKVCQHCAALFWLEEKRTGMPAYAAPQYQRCCAGGRVVLRAYGEYPAYIVDIVEGLIQFLNQKNTLVRLFHTARDKLQEADIPEFQIRLFGVIGANQYELPTADAIGAIVYDGGPESMIEYDVIIQRHSGEAESVNKLHPAWHCSFLFSLFTVNKAII